MKHIAAILVSGMLISSFYVQAGEVGSSEKASCPFDLPEGVTEGEDFIFGYVTVPEQHANPEGPVIQLAVGIFPCRGKDPAPDPIVLTPAGPGECIMDSLIPTFTGEGSDMLLAKRTAIGIAVRGTCYSKPDLICKERQEMKLAIINQNLSAKEMTERLLESTRVSRDRFIDEGINLAAYNSVESAADVIMVMDALGYDKFNLFGNSAGTMLAQHVMRDHPKRLRSVIMSSPVPVGIPVLQEMIGNGVKTLRQVFERFSENENFNSLHPNLEDRFLSLMKELDANPITISVKNPENEEMTDLVLNGARLAQWLFVQMYWNMQYPYELGKIVSGDYSPIEKDPGIFFPMHRFSFGLSYSIICTELAGAVTEIEIDERYTAFSDAVTGMGFGAEFNRHLCKIWDVPPLDKHGIAPIKSDVPTLILCGEFDHVCPPEYGDFLKQNLRNAFVYTLRGVAHSPIDAGAGPIMMVLEFLDDPAKEPDSSHIQGYGLDPKAE